VIGEGQTTDRISHTPNFFHFNNQQSSLDNHQSDVKNAVRWLTHTGSSCVALRAKTKQPGAGERLEAIGLREQPNSRETLVRSSAGIQ